MNIVCSCASSRWSTSIFTAIPLYARTAVAIEPDTVGAPIACAFFSRSRSISPSRSKKRLWFRGSRASSGVTSPSGGEPRKKVSLPSVRGRGEAISIQRAASSDLNAWGVPTGIAPQAPAWSRRPRPSK
jgi:hypothetical protein